MGDFGDSNHQIHIIKLVTNSAILDCPDEEEPCSVVPCESRETNPPECAVNPFLRSMWSKWRPERERVHLANRTQTPSSSADNTNIREDGIYASYTPFWDFDTDEWGTQPTGWQWTQRALEHHPVGQGVEDEDALGIRSAAVMGHQGTLPLVMAKNARYRDVAFDGFEDYPTDCGPAHFQFPDFLNWINDETAHTGTHSMEIEPGNTLTHTTTLSASPCAQTDDPLAPYNLIDCDCIGRFQPLPCSYDASDPVDVADPTKRWVLSLWYRTSMIDNATVSDQPLPGVGIVVNGTMVDLQLESKSPIIDGWQQANYLFAYNGVDGDAMNLFITNPSSFFTTYVDDIRLHPFQAQMKSYVYDPISLRLWAELDERNYATFYEYDEEGNLLRVKKETERGVMTLRTSSSSTHHNP